MIKKQSKYYKLTITLFIIYLTLLIWALLFKLEFNISPYIRSLNLIPYGKPAVANGKTNYSEIILNIAAFVPFGLFISIIKPSLKFFFKLLPIILTTVIIEFLQYVLKIGATDITDAINNTLGGIIGILLYSLFVKCFGKNINKILIILLSALIITSASIVTAVKIMNM